MSRRGPAHPERSFGLSVGGVGLVAAIFLWWRGSPTAAVIMGIIGVALIGFALTAPRVLSGPSRVWWRVVHVLGFVNARVILTVLFATLIVPIGLVWRLGRKDPLGRDRRRWPGWTPYPSRYRDRKHYSRMY
jgi:hypothetical protein